MMPFFPFLKFFIITAKCDFLDEKHVVFGKVIDGLGMLMLRKIENVATVIWCESVYARIQ